MATASSSLFSSTAPPPHSWRGFCLDARLSYKLQVHSTLVELNCAYLLLIR